MYHIFPLHFGPFVQSILMEIRSVVKQRVNVVNTTAKLSINYDPLEK
jgi:hypothetical protein